MGVQLITWLLTTHPIAISGIAQHCDSIACYGEVLEFVTGMSSVIRENDKINFSIKKRDRPKD